MRVIKAFLLACVVAPPPNLLSAFAICALLYPFPTRIPLSSALLSWRPYHAGLQPWVSTATNLQ